MVAFREPFPSLVALSSATAAIQRAPLSLGAFCDAVGSALSRCVNFWNAAGSAKRRATRRTESFCEIGVIGSIGVRSCSALARVYAGLAPWFFVSVLVPGSPAGGVPSP